MQNDRGPMLIMEIETLQSMSELAAGCDISDKTVFTHLKQIRKIKKLKRWMPYELSESNARRLLRYMLNRHNKEGILN